MEFANRNVRKNRLVDLVKDFYRVVPTVLTEHKKVSNPWPNVDAGSGALF